MFGFIAKYWFGGVRGTTSDDGVDEDDETDGGGVSGINGGCACWLGGEMGKWC